ncbi:MAG: GGDEF domain-containing protein [Clostridiales bacterium]|nr:GGDEF domain-containing protein [Clostridiales bacterium]
MNLSHNYIYFYILFIQFYIVIYIVKSIKLGRETTRVYLAIVVSIILMLTLKLLISNFNGNNSLGSFTYILVHLTHFFNILPLILSLYYFDLHIINDQKELGKRKLSYLIVWFILFIYGLSNIWTNYIFVVDDLGNLVRKSGTYLHIYFQVGLILVYGMSSIKYFKRCVSPVFPLYLALVFLPMLGGILQKMFPELPAVWSIYSLLSLYIFIFLVREDMNRDSLTDVFSRGQFEEHLRKKLKMKHPISVVLIDIDEFKAVNDNYGHNEGDELLIKFTSLVKASVRSTDMVARIGGDEFVIIFESISPQSGVKAINRIKNEVSAFNDKNLKPYKIRFSTGHQYIDHPRDYTPHEVMKVVDQLMYEEKTKNHQVYHNQRAKDIEAQTILL